MKILNEVLELINPENIICNEEAVEIKIKMTDSKTIRDARSAAFYAFGKSKINNQNTVLILNGNYLPNIYTVLTEAWFQKSNLIIIALYPSIYEVKTNYLDRCTVSNITFMEKDYEQFKEQIKKSIKMIGPKLINIAIDKKTNVINYGDILNEVKKVMKSNDTLLIYNSDINGFPCKVINIEEKYKYGIISKYLGYLNGTNANQQLLICTKECLEIDLNILNNRAMINKFKAIIFGDIKQFENWIEKNNIKLIKSKKINESIDELYNLNQATILNIKED